MHAGRVREEGREEERDKHRERDRQKERVRKRETQLSLGPGIVWDFWDEV